MAKRFLIAALLAGLFGCWAGEIAHRPALAATSPTAERKAAPATSRAATRPTSSPSTQPTTSTRPASQPTTAAAQALAKTILELQAESIKLAKAGKWAQCQAKVEEVLKLDGENPTAWYNMACVHARLNRPQQAIECLRSALKSGYSDFRYMERDEDLASLRDQPGYKAVQARNLEIQSQRAARLYEELRRQFGAGCICEIDHPNRLVFATNIDRRTLEELRAHLTAHAEALWADLFSTRLEQYVTIVVPRAGDPAYSSRSIGGYYMHEQRLLVARQIGMVLNHEFTHALHHADQDGLGQQHPIWITEALACLYESSQVVDGHILPLPNHRLNVLKQLAAAKRTVPWKDLFNYTQKGFMEHAVAAYPECRYILMYLHQRGLLGKWYGAYTAGFEKDAGGGRAMEEVFGKKLAEIEKDWLTWVVAQAPLPARLAPNAGCLGVRTIEAADGLSIVGLLPGSGAEKAGLKGGDLIVGIDGQRMLDSGELLVLVSAHKVGDAVDVEFRRAGEYQTVTVTLGAMPPDQAATTPRPATTSRPATTTRPATMPATASMPATTSRPAASARPASTSRPAPANMPAASTAPASTGGAETRKAA